MCPIHMRMPDIVVTKHIASKSNSQMHPSKRYSKKKRVKCSANIALT